MFIQLIQSMDKKDRKILIAINKITMIADNRAYDTYGCNIWLEDSDEIIHVVDKFDDILEKIVGQGTSNG